MNRSDHEQPQAPQDEPATEVIDCRFWQRYDGKGLDDASPKEAILWTFPEYREAAKSLLQKIEQRPDRHGYCERIAKSWRSAR